MLQEYLRRIGLLLVGLLVSAIGITLMLQANIGLELIFAGRVSASVRWQIFSSARYSSTSCCT